MFPGVGVGIIVTGYKQLTFLQAQPTDPKLKLQNHESHYIKIFFMKNNVWMKIHTTTSWQEVLPCLLEQNSTPNVPERNQFKRAIFQIHPIPTPSVATEFLLLLFSVLLLSACSSNLFWMPVVFDFSRAARSFFICLKRRWRGNNSKEMEVNVVISSYHWHPYWQFWMKTLWIIFRCSIIQMTRPYFTRNHNKQTNKQLSVKCHFPWFLEQ